MYEQFIKHNQDFPDTYKELEKYLRDPNLGNKPAGLASILISPIQRGPRYGLLIKEAAKNADDDAMRMQILSATNAEVKLGMDSVNEARASEALYQFGDYTRAGWSWISNTLFGPQDTEHCEGFVLVDDEGSSNTP